MAIDSPLENPTDFYEVLSYLMRIYYPPVNSHRPRQIGLGRLVSTRNGLFSGSNATFPEVRIY